jgi:hypothetical protein
MGDGINHWVDLPYFSDNEALTNLIDGAPDLLNTLGELAAAIGDDPAFITTVATNLSNHQSDTTNIHGIADTSLLATTAYADSAEADAITAAGTAADTKISNAVAALTKSSVGLGNVDNTSDADKPVSTAAQTALDLKAPKADPTFTGTVSGVTATHVGLGNVDNTADADKPVSTATQTALDAKASDTDLSDHTSATTNVHGILDTEELATKEYVTQEIGNSEVDQAALAGEGITWNDVNTTFEIDTLVTADLTTAQTLTNKTLTSPVINTPTGITKSDVGLGNADNTSDANKPVSTATQTALDLKAPLDSPALTGTATAVNLTISGDLTVNGTTTNLNSTSLVIEDKNVVLGDTATPTDTTADGGGITLKGATDKTFNWVDATDAWTSSEHINLASGKTLKYNGTDLVASQSGNSGKFLTTDGTSSSWATVSGYSAPTLGSTSIASGATVTTVAGLTLTSPVLTGTVTLPQGKLTGGSTTVSANTATTVSTVALADFTTMEYIVSIKQGSKIRSSKVLVQTDGTAVDSVEHSILETGGAMTGVNVTAAVSSTDAILTVTITDASSTNAVVKVINTII